jgi:hypothetical protein
MASLLDQLLAKPVTYTGFTITDGKLGSWSFHNARVYLTFQGDTNNVHLITPLPPNLIWVEPQIFWLTKLGRRP